MRTSPGKTYGSVSESLCAAYYSYLGYIVSKPISEDARYDFLVDDGESIKKIQCKTSMRKSAREYPSMDMVSKTRKKGYVKGDFDFIWILTNYGVYLIDANDIKMEGNKHKSFALTPKYNAYLIDLPFLKEQPARKAFTGYVTEIEKTRIINLAKIGDTHKSIALTMGLKIRHVQEILDKCNLKTRRIVTDEMKEEIVKMHKKGLPSSIICDVTGMCTQQVNRCLRDCGINKRPKRKSLSQDVKDQAYQMKQDGVPFSDIADSLGLYHDGKSDT